MRKRIGQIKVYLMKFVRLFIATGGWKSFLFAATISVIVAWVVGDNMFVYARNTEPGCFALISACIWIGIFNSIQSVCRERDIIKREHRSGLHISSYILARAIYELIICLIQTIIIIVICGCLREYPEEALITNSYLLDMFITFFLVFYCSDCLGIAISSIVKTTTTAMTVMPFILIIQLVMSGVLFKLEGSAEKVAKITISKWGMEAFGAITNINELPPDEKGLPYITKEVYEFTKGHVQTSWMWLVGFIVLYIAIAIISLKFVDKDKR